MRRAARAKRAAKPARARPSDMSSAYAVIAQADNDQPGVEADDQAVALELAELEQHDVGNDVGKTLSGGARARPSARGGGGSETDEWFRALGEGPPPDEGAIAEQALAAWEDGVAQQQQQLFGRRGLGPDGIRHFVLDAGGGQLPGTLLGVAKVASAAAFAIGRQSPGRGLATAPSTPSAGAAVPLREAETGWKDEFDAKKRADDAKRLLPTDEGDSGGDDELAAAYRACPRLRLLSRPQLLSLLHMTHPCQMNDEGLWDQMSDFQRVEFAEPPSGEGKYAAFLPRGADDDVTAVQRCSRKDYPKGEQYPAGDTHEVLGALRLQPPLSTASFGYGIDCANDPDADRAPPQAVWIAALFGRIEQTLRVSYLHLRPSVLPQQDTQKALPAASLVVTTLTVR